MACQVVNVMICRTRRQSLLSAGIFSNRLIWLGIATEQGLPAAISHVTVLQPFFGTAPIGWLELSLGLPFALVILVGDELRRWLTW